VAVQDGVLLPLIDEPEHSDGIWSQIIYGRCVRPRTRSAIACGHLPKRGFSVEPEFAPAIRARATNRGLMVRDRRQARRAGFSDAPAHAIVTARTHPISRVLAVVPAAEKNPRPF
jgi:hypothetical protein